MDDVDIVETSLTHANMGITDVKPVVVIITYGIVIIPIDYGFV